MKSTRMPRAVMSLSSREGLNRDRETKTGEGSPPTRQSLSRKTEGFGVIAYRFEPDGIHR